MATASKRITRKDIRQPDKFITFARAAYRELQKHQGKLFILAGVVIAAIIAFAAWQLYASRQDAQAGRELGGALALYHAGNYRDALAGFEKVETYRWSRLYSLALLYQSNSHLGLKNTDKAIETAQRLLRSGSGDPLIRQSALVALAHAEEQKGACKEAVPHYAEAEKVYYAAGESVPGPLRDQASLGKARCLSHLGDLKGAIAAYREYLKQPDRELAGYVSAQLAELEAKVAAQPVK